MSRFSNTTHKSDLLKFDKEFPWTSPDLMDEHPTLNGILNRCIQSFQLINFILEKRDKQVNEYRRKMSSEEKLNETWWYLILFTETFFSHVKNLLNAHAELIHTLYDNFPESTNGDFTEMWEFLKISTNQDQDLQNFFKNNLKWYELLSQFPRNKFVIHDKKTSGYGMNDHGIDIYVGKHIEHDITKLEEASALLQKIIDNHAEFSSLPCYPNNFHSSRREILKQFDLLNDIEIEWLKNASGIAGFDFPYIPHVILKLQEFVTFVEELLSKKYLTCPSCSQQTLKIQRTVRDITIRKFDPNNIWFDWICSNCDYTQEFNSSRSDS